MIHKVTSGQHLPVSLIQLKNHLRIEHVDEDDYLIFLIQSATEATQNYVGRSLLLQTWQKVYYPEQKKYCQISPQSVLPLRLVLSFPPVITIKTVKGTYGGTIAQDIKTYQLKFNGDQAFLEINQPLSMVEVVYEAGYGERPEAVPVDLRQAILQLSALYYQKRQSFSLSEEPYLISLLQPYRVFRQV